MPSTADRPLADALNLHSLYYAAALSGSHVARIT